MNKILYLHGFNSSPQSHKACQLQQHMNQLGIGHLVAIPEIKPAPADAIEQLQAACEEIMQDYELALIGSSLGGFYSTWLAEKYNCKAVLVNPAVNPHELLRQNLGEYTNYYTDKIWVLNETHIEQLKQLVIDTITQPERYLLMLQTGDETLDYRLAQGKYVDCPSIIEQGGDHAFTGFERHFDRILAFCNVTVS